MSAEVSTEKSKYATVTPTGTFLSGSRHVKVVRRDRTGNCYNKHRHHFDSINSAARIECVFQGPYNCAISYTICFPRCKAPTCCKTRPTWSQFCSKMSTTSVSFQSLRGYIYYYSSPRLAGAKQHSIYDRAISELNGRAAERRWLTLQRRTRSCDTVNTLASSCARQRDLLPGVAFARASIDWHDWLTFCLLQKLIGRCSSRTNQAI